MTTIKSFLTKYQKSLDLLDLDLLIAQTIKKTREFVLSHPEHKISTACSQQLAVRINRRIKHEPLAYILGEKEFYGLKFKVDKAVLVPRPETELLVDLALRSLQNVRRKTMGIKVIDIGTGSGNIIISLANKLNGLKSRITNCELLATDISKKAIDIAKQNAKLHKVSQKIKFYHGDLLIPIIKMLPTTGNRQLIIVLANLPYLSLSLYRSTHISIRMYEPKKALFGGKNGLKHYSRLIQQIKKLSCQSSRFSILCFMEISPEQKATLFEIVRNYLPESKIKFYRDLSGKWRVCSFEIKK